MSSSVSFGTSVDLETLTSRSLAEIDKDIEGYENELRNFSKSRIKQDKSYNIFASQQNSQQQQQQHMTKKAANFPTLIEADFYEEVDERMSRNSVEYPEQQARYVGRWVNDMDFSKSHDSITDHNGNVVGIRGFPKGSKATSSDEQKQQRSSYNKLKFSYSKLQTDYDKLQAHLGTTTDKFKRMLKKREHDIDLLKGFIEKQETRNRSTLVEEHVRCCCTIAAQYHNSCASNRPKSSPQAVEAASYFEKTGNSVKQQEEFVRLQQEFRLMELKLSSINKEHEVRVGELQSENDRLKNESNRSNSELNKELNRLRNQVEALSLEPCQKTLISLRNENGRLKDMLEMNKVEMETLKENYRQLERNLRSLIDEQKLFTCDKDDEMSKLMVELCRLQVYQPKLEATLDNERAIKSELQDRLESLLKENINLKEQLKDEKLELNRERTRSKRIESNELDNLQAELAQWHDKYYKLKKEKADIEELVRISKLKLASIDTRHRSELDLAEQTKREEVGNLLSRNVKLEADCSNLRAKLGTLESKLDEYSLENNRLQDNIVELNKKLLTSDENFSQVNEKDKLLKKLKDCGELGVTLRKQLEVSQAKNREMLEEYESLKGQLVRSKQQVEQFRDRFRNQQKTLDELKGNRDDELAKLRVSLNFERYNRQVALN